MQAVLKRIRRAIIAGNYEFSADALAELDADALSESDALESILNAKDIYKAIRSTSRWCQKRRELLHIIIAPTLDGILIHTKGKLVADAGVATYYFLVSSKRALR